ncbi:HAD hydrolase family protein [Pseudoalteromonas sp. NEC-BIFX-2020_015]|uniref:HAD family hydrolase n=1 Tax=Pseudoalteromonas sp. NEC-BIFX-2020_015 TaxID=2729544 RepID=UPI0014614F60|nr:HAD family hydrolase [Pseudoalteromonas sp. NEC-BIFX-2020_015]NMR24035.1 HAD hydrolase family protein [Pseudoalteromonas sp. NEC-BIFX-2020_015]
MEMLIKQTSRLFVFTDLDDTLFNSLKKTGSDLSIVSTTDSQGKAQGYSSLQQQKLLNIFEAANGIFIPVTGRRTSSFLNCSLPTIKYTPYAVVSHGAVILDRNRRLLDEWHTFIDGEFNLAVWKSELVRTFNHLHDHFTALDNGVRVRLIVDQGLTAYICVKVSKNDYSKDKAKDVDSFLKSILLDDMLLHSNGRNFAILPPYARKEIAVKYIKNKLKIGEHDTVFSIGDSNSDLPFMRESDFLIAPNGSQILARE